MQMEIPSSVSKLALAFPVGANPDRMGATVQMLKQWRKKAVDVQAAVEKMIESREAATFPTMAQILRAVSDVRAERTNAKVAAQSQMVERTLRPLTQDEREQCVKVRLLGQAGLFWCGAQEAFVSDHRSPSTFQLSETGELLGYRDANRHDIFRAFDAQFGNGPPPKLESKKEVIEDIIGDLF